MWGWPTNVYGWTIDQNTGVLTAITAGMPTTAGSFGDSHAFCVTVDPTGRFAYVCNQDDGTVSVYVIDQTTGALTNTQQAQSGLRPRSVSIEPTGRFAYVVNYGVNPPNICQGTYAHGTGQGCVVRAFSISQTTGALTSIGANDMLATGTNPIWSTIDPAGRVLYTVNINSNNVSAFLIDSTTGALSALGTYPAGNGPISINVDPSGKFVYVPNVFDGSTYSYIRDGAGNLTQTSSISGFAPNDVTSIQLIFYQALVQQPINGDGSSIFNAKRGVVPVKFTLTQNNVATCALPPATIAVTRTAGGTLGTIDESVYTMAADSGSTFRIDLTACQYIYNLASSSLGVGVYRADIFVSGNAVGSAVFALK